MVSRWAFILSIHVRGNWVSGRYLTLLTISCQRASDPSSKPDSCFQDMTGLHAGDVGGLRETVRGYSAGSPAPWVSGLSSWTPDPKVTLKDSKDLSPGIPCLVVIRSASHATGAK